MPEWLIPALTFLSGIIGGFVGARVPIVRLETQMADIRDWKKRAHQQLHAHNEDLLIHDLELDEVMEKLNLKRAQRQRVRDTYDG